MVSEEFNDMCAAARVECRVQALPNPGDAFGPLRLLTFTNYNPDSVVTVVERHNNKVHQLLPKGTLQIGIPSSAPLPLVMKGTLNENERLLD
jgi:hypothetical protein